MFPRTPLNPIATVVSCIVLTFANAETPKEQPLPPSPTLAGQLALPFSDHAVLQQKIPLPVWGDACLPGTKVTVRFNGQTRETLADPQGGWKVVFDPMTADKLTSVNEAPEGHEMVITFEKDGKKAETSLKDLLVGETWLCAGQSNIAGNMRTNTSVHFPENSIEMANYPAFRQLVSSKDGNWHWADGKIDGTELVVSSPEVSEPVAVRYAHTNNPNGPLLYNQDGFPAAPFATDEQTTTK